MQTLTFEEWMKSVDNKCLCRFGCSVRDLPDMAFRDAYDEGESPQSFVMDIRLEDF